MSWIMAVNNFTIVLLKLHLREIRIERESFIALLPPGLSARARKEAYTDQPFETRDVNDMDH